MLCLTLAIIPGKAGRLVYRTQAEAGNSFDVEYSRLRGPLEKLLQDGTALTGCTL